MEGASYEVKVSGALNGSLIANQRLVGVTFQCYWRMLTDIIEVVIVKNYLPGKAPSKGIICELTLDKKRMITCEMTFFE